MWILEIFFLRLHETVELLVHLLVELLHWVVLLWLLLRMELEVGVDSALGEHWLLLLLGEVSVD